MPSGGFPHRLGLPQRKTTKQQRLRGNRPVTPAIERKRKESGAKRPQRIPLGVRREAAILRPSSPLPQRGRIVTPATTTFTSQRGALLIALILTQAPINRITAGRPPGPQPYSKKKNNPSYMNHSTPVNALQASSLPVDSRVDEIRVLPPPNTQEPLLHVLLGRALLRTLTRARRAHKKKHTLSASRRRATHTYFDGGNNAPGRVRAGNEDCQHLAKLGAFVPRVVLRGRAR
mmetsp:Transcript_3668/g.10800  ORF Transcript_3668/g.10800 Transcript_3668/m.10800 type:complete len:232 (+) Transcript_3668:664-1359(+)